MTAPGIYQARVITPFAGGFATVVIPQLFGDVHVYVGRFAGTALPLTPTMGWVMFEGGDESNPVWIGADTSPFAEEPGGGVVVEFPLGSYQNPWVVDDDTLPPWQPGDFMLKAVR